MAFRLRHTMIDQRLIERDGPLETLIDAAHRAASGHGCIAVVAGEAGIGKTALLRAFAQQLDSGWRMLWGGCEALFTPRPLGPLQDIAQALDPRVAALLDQTAAPERLFPALLSALQDADQATVLVFEDVHWADHATLDLMKYLGRRVPLLRTLLVLSLRSDEVGPDHSLMQVLGDLPPASVRIDLQPLSPRGVAMLVGQAGRRSDDLHRITAGNPFFVTELLACGDAAGRIPASIRDAVWSRLARLTPAECDVLQVISIVPGSMERWLLRALLGADAEAAVDRCVARGMLLRDGQGNVSFRHELARQATLERLPPSVQQSLHARVERAMASAAAAHGLLARRVHHAAGADDGARVLELAPQAAAQAARLGAHQQAAAQLATALRYAAQAPAALAAQLHEDWAYEAGLALGIDDSIIAARQRAITLWRELGRTDKVGHNLRWLSRLHWYRGEAQSAERYVDAAVRELEDLPPGPELAMAYSARSQLHMLHTRTDEAIDWGERAVALATDLGETETRVHALNNVGTALLFSGRPGGREKLEESLALALRHGFHEQAARAYTNYAEYAVVFKDFALAERILAEGIAFDTQHDLDSWTHYLVGWRAQLCLDQGRLHEAETIASGVLGLEHLTLIMRLPALRVLGRVRMRRGEADGLALLRRFLREALATTEAQYIVPARLALAEAAWLAEDLPACRETLDGFADLDPRQLNPWERGELAAWRKRAGLPQTEADPAALPPPYAAELADEPAAAAEHWARLGLPFEAALAWTRVGGAGAPAALARAVCLFEDIGAQPAALLARRLARRLGADEHLPKVRRGPYASARLHPLGLTRREIQVLGLIAEGMGNRQIAQRLMRSPRTIEHHVSAVLGKLNAGTRMDVMLRLRSEPWLLSSAEPPAGREN